MLTQKDEYICKRALARISMLRKLNYVGVPFQDLVDIFIVFVRSLLEYCCVTWHSSLTIEQSEDIERAQRTALKVIIRKRVGQGCEGDEVVVD